MLIQKKINKWLFVKKWSPAKKNRAVLLVCMGMALVFWFLVKMSQPYETFFVIPIDYQLPVDKVFSIMPTKKISAQIEGTGWDLMNKFYFNTPQSLFVNLEQNIPPYLQASELTERVALALSGREITILGINPNFIDLAVENRTAHKVPVRLRDSLIFEPEYFLKDTIQFSPDSIAIYGPASIISKYEFWETEVLHIEQINSDIWVNLALKPSLYPQVTLMPDTISVYIKTDQYGERKITVPIRIKNAKDSVKIFPNTIQLHVIVGITDFDKLKDEDFIAEIDLKDITPSSKNNSVPILIASQPSFVKAIHFSPKSADYFILQ
ncbi:MAG: hypothetical protein HC892_22870 [Saprospiraceae bacterium]|nr:hypothetical protein [Saprospiraceae bacterium]